MKIGNNYTFLTLRKSRHKRHNLITTITFIICTIFICTYILSIVLPTYNHYQFVNNGNHKYVYLIHSSANKRRGNSTKFIFYRGNITSHPDTNVEHTGDNESKFKYLNKINLYITHNNTDISNTIFSEKNMIRKKKVEGPHIWISYETSKALRVKIGDEVYLRFYLNHEKKSKDISFKVSGICKTKYNDDKPIKTNLDYGNGIVFLDDETFKWILHETYEGKSNSRCVFLDSEINDLNTFLLMSKDDQIRKTLDYISNNLISLIFILVCTIIIFVFILILKMSYTLNRHSENFINLQNYGLSINAIRKNFIKKTMLKFSIAYVVALIFVKYIFLQELLGIYVELLPLVICFIFLITISIITSVIYSKRLKKAEKLIISEDIASNPS